MPNDTQQISLMRFSEDHTSGSISALPTLSQQRQVLRHSHLEISPLLTPELDVLLQSVLEKCSIRKDQVACFVKNEPGINASCRLSSDDGCVLVVSSGAFNSLTSEEIQFVIGHELGHFMFQHVGFTEGSEESLWLSRAAEISSDRVGMLAAGSVTPALRTIIKVLSGLNDDLIRFDVSQLLAGLDSSATLRRLNKSSTHPTLLVRARALLHWDLLGSSDPDEISRVNQRVSNDMYKFIDKSSRTKLADMQNDICVWKLITLMFEEHYSIESITKRVGSEFDRQVMTSINGLVDEGLEYLGSESERRLSLSIEHLELEFPRLSRSTIDQAFSRAYTLLGL